MTKAYILEIGELNNFRVGRETKDLSGTHFFTLCNPGTDLVAMYRDHKDGDYYFMGLCKSHEANKILDRIPETR